MADDAEGAAAPRLAWTGISDKRSYYKLFAGYVIALLATGVATMALALLAFDLAGEDSGAVIGTALSIKMLAYVLAAPLIVSLAERLPRRALLIGLDVLRAVSLLALPFVTQVWQIYVLVFIFALASATFGLIYLAVVPYLLGSEKDYTQSLARSRIAAELEGSVSPLVGAGLLLIMATKGMFLLTAGAFVVSALLVRAAQIPDPGKPRPGSFWSKTLRGARLFVAVPEFRAIFAFDAAAAMATAMVMVNTIVIVQGKFDLGRDATAIAFFTFGAGSIVGAVLIPFILRRVEDRFVMLIGASILVAALILGFFQFGPAWLVFLWFALGLGVAWALTPATYVIRRIAAPEDLQTLFAAQQSISNLCLLFAYPLAGWLGAELGMRPTFIILGAGAALASWAAIRFWPKLARPASVQ
jgi:MFS family permease